MTISVAGYKAIVNTADITKEGNVPVIPTAHVLPISGLPCLPVTSNQGWS
jgi:hypothetical protein